MEGYGYHPHATLIRRVALTAFIAVRESAGYKRVIGKRQTAQADNDVKNKIL